MAGHEGGKFIVIIAFAMNMCIAIFKGIVAYFTGSSAMAAETVHSLADSGNQVLLLVGIRQSKKGACKKHPYGRGKESYFWAFIVTICLFTVGACYSIYEGIHKLIEPPEAFDHIIWAYIVLGLSIILEGISMRAAVVEAKKRKGNKTYLQFIRKSKNTEVIVVFLEDLAALLGLTIALAGLIVAQVTGLLIFDGIASILIGLLLIVVAYLLAGEIKSLLIGEAAKPEKVEKIMTTLCSSPSVEKTISIDTLQMGPRSFIAAIKVDFHDSLTLADIEKEINNLEDKIRLEVPDAYKIYIEPDRYDPAYDE